ncbi:MAG: acyl-CoA dehydrogenase family protein [Caldilineaceae bacterium]
MPPSRSCPTPVSGDHEGKFPRELLYKMGELGYLGVPVPEEYGGAGLDYISEAIVFEEVGYADSSVRTTLSVQMSLVELTILKWGTEEHKQTYLPKLCSGEWIGCFGLTEPNAGSDAGNVATTAKREGDEWCSTARRSGSATAPGPMWQSSLPNLSPAPNTGAWSPFWWTPKVPALVAAR